VLCPGYKLNYNGRYFFIKIKAKNTATGVATAGIFNAEI